MYGVYCVYNNEHGGPVHHWSVQSKKQQGGHKWGVYRASGIPGGWLDFWLFLSISFLAIFCCFVETMSLLHFSGAFFMQKERQRQRKRASCYKQLKCSWVGPISRLLAPYSLVVLVLFDRVCAWPMFSTWQACQHDVDQLRFIVGRLCQQEMQWSTQCCPPSGKHWQTLTLISAASVWRHQHFTALLFRFDPEDIDLKFSSLMFKSVQSADVIGGPGQGGRLILIN